MKMYELKFTCGSGIEAAVDRVVLQGDGEAVGRAMRELLQMPGRHAVEVSRDDVLIFRRSRRTHSPLARTTHDGTETLPPMPITMNRKRQIVEAEARYAWREDFLRRLATNGVYVVGGLTREHPHRATEIDPCDAPPGRWAGQNTSVRKIRLSEEATR